MKECKCLYCVWAKFERTCIFCPFPHGVCMEKDKKAIKPKKSATRQNIPANAKRVVRVEDGVEYQSALDAARKNFGDPTSILKACRNKTTAAGYHWEFAQKGENEK